MKRLNETQKLIEGLAPKVPQLTKAQKDWAIKTFKYFRLLNSKATSYVCPECHERLPFKKGRKMDKTIRCPHCGTLTTIRAYENAKTKLNRHQDGFFQVLNIVEGWQVTRLIYMERNCYLRKENTPWEFHECCQAWNNPDSADTYFRALPKKVFASWYFNPYSIRYWGYEHNADTDTYGIYVAGYNKLEPRGVNSQNYFNCDNIYPRSQILPYYKKRGLTAKALNQVKPSCMAYFEGCVNGEYTSIFETLMKSKDYDFLDKLTEYPYSQHKDAYFTALKICKRNNYDYKKNLTEWFDLIKLLIDTGYDYHSPHYVCPADLHEMHQRMIVAKRKYDEMSALKKAQAHDKEYRKRIARYLGMDIHDDFLTIVVLPDVQAFKEEADHLHHCVYRCAYYNREDSLLLSARDDSGKRWETIEVSLKTFKILQAYGYGDKFTERHQQILDLVNRNMEQIRKCKKMRMAS